MGQELSAVCLGLGASMTLSLAIRARSLALQRPARLAFVAAFVSLPLAVAVALSADVDARWLALAAFVVSALVSAVCSWSALRVPWQVGPTGSSPRYLALGLAFLGLALLQVLSSICALSKGSTRMLAPALLAVALLSASFVAGLALARRHAARGARSLAAWGYGLACWSAACLVLPAAAAMEAFPSVLAALVVLLFPLGLPLISRRLVGVGPEPLDLAIHVEPLGSRSLPKRALLVTLCLLAFGAQAFEFGQHFGRCRGELVSAPPASNWQALEPAVAFDGRKLGPFVLRASHFDYRGYPAAYQSAALFDPRLCFSEGISLRAWFEDEPYHFPDLLRLRSEPHSGLFMVSVRESEASETLLASFRRDLNPSGNFDSEFNARAIGTGFALLALGVATTLAVHFRPRVTTRIARVLPTLAVLCLVIAIFDALMVEQRAGSDGTPRPGREIATTYPWFM